MSIQLADARGIVQPEATGAFEQTLRAGRLAKLAGLGLAQDAGQGRWRLVPDLAETLTRIGERGDIIRTMQRAFTAARVERAAADQAIYDPAAENAAPLTGRVLARGLADELRDRHYLVVDGIDGRSHYVARGTQAAEGVGEGAVVRIAPAHAGVRTVDRTILTIAAANGGRYDIDAHLAYDPAATQAFAETHVRRLEAMRRAGTGIERAADGSWRIASDHLERVERFETTQARTRPVEVELLAAEPLERLTKADGATWLDQRLVRTGETPARDTGFGSAVRDAEVRRRQWLISEGLGSETQGVFQPAPDLIETLRRRELLRVAAGLSRELDLPFAESRSGMRVEGTLARRLDLVAGASRWSNARRILRWCHGGRCSTDISARPFRAWCAAKGSAGRSAGVAAARPSHDPAGRTRPAETNPPLAGVVCRGRGSLFDGVALVAASGLGDRSMAKLTLSDVAEKVRDIDFVVLMTRTEGGSIAGRPMSNNREVDFDGDSWFFTLEEMRTASDIRRDPNVALVYQSKSGLLAMKPFFLTLEGSASLIQDKAQFAEHWTKGLDAWFEQGIDTPGLVLIKVEAERLHYWDGMEEGEINLAAATSPAER